MKSLETTSHLLSPLSRLANRRPSSVTQHLSGRDSKVISSGHGAASTPLGSPSTPTLLSARLSPSLLQAATNVHQQRMALKSLAVTAVSTVASTAVPLSLSGSAPPPSFARLSVYLSQIYSPVQTLGFHVQISFSSLIENKLKS